MERECSEWEEVFVFFLFFKLVFKAELFLGSRALVWCFDT